MGGSFLDVSQKYPKIIWSQCIELWRFVSFLAKKHVEFNKLYFKDVCDVYNEIRTIVHFLKHISTKTKKSMDFVFDLF